MTLPAGFGFQVEVKLTDVTANAIEAFDSKALELIISGVKAPGLRAYCR